MKKLRIITGLLISFILVVLLVAVANAKIYETKNLVIVYDNPVDLTLAIPAVKKARTFFKQLGYKVDYPVKLIFQDAVYLDIHVMGSDKIIKQQVYGVYFGNYKGEEKNTIKVSSWGTDYLHAGSRDCFGIPVTLELHATIITHETAHLLLRAIGGKLGHGVNEYIAYTTQIATMPESLRDGILNANKDTEPFDYELMINSMLHSHNPHKFGIMSYLHFKTTGPETFKKIVAGELDPDIMINSFYGN